MSFKDTAYRALGITLAVYLVFNVMGSIVLNATAHLYYWGAAGLVLAMRRLEQSAVGNSRIAFTPPIAGLAQPAPSNFRGPRPLLGSGN